MEMKWNPLKMLTANIAIDLGTANTLIWVSGKGIVLDEPSVVTRNRLTGKVVAVGIAAKAMLGKTPQELETVRPLKDGVISDFEMTDQMLYDFIRKLEISRIARPRMVICVPKGITPVERRAVKESALRANARDVFLIDEPVAAAIGLEIDIDEPVGNMIVDIGGGTTEIAVIALNGVVTSTSIKVAGDEMDDIIVSHFKQHHSLLIGERTAEQIKCSVGSAMQINDQQFQVKGRNLMTGIPQCIEANSAEIREALKPAVDDIVKAIRATLDQTPPELASDIMDRGIILTGGGSLLLGLEERIKIETNVPANVAEDPLRSVVKGTGIVLENIEKYKSVLS